MTAATALISANMKLMIFIRSGGEKGHAFQISPPQISIGRDAENDIVLTDPRCSRVQATIHIDHQRIYIEDRSSRKSTMVNGVYQPLQDLSNGDVIQIGATELLFTIELPSASITPPRPQAVANSPVNSPVNNPVTNSPAFSAETTPPLSFSPPAQPSAGQPRPSNEPLRLKSPGSMSEPMHLHRGPSPAQRRRPQKQDFWANNRNFIIGGLVLLILMALLFSSGAKRTLDPGVRTDNVVQNDITIYEGNVNNVLARRKFASDEDRTRYYESQRHFLEGFRDYQDHQFSRAMQSFQTSSAIDPQNQSAKRYYEIAQKARQQLLEESMIEGRRYYEKGMFVRCSAALSKVLIEIQDVNDIKYRESQALRAQCDALSKKVD